MKIQQLASHLALQDTYKMMRIINVLDAQRTVLNAQAMTSVQDAMKDTSHIMDNALVNVLMELTQAKMI